MILAMLVAGVLFWVAVGWGVKQAVAGPGPRVVIGDAAFFDSRCGDAYHAVRWYRARYDEHRARLGLSAAPPVEQAMTCARTRERARYWIGAAAVNRKAVEALGHRPDDPPAAVICQVFGSYCDQAIRVARCETGGTFDTDAQNGQYLGLFQMGSSERARFGHGPTALEQARAAYRYFVESGRDWSPWSCQP